MTTNDLSLSFGRRALLTNSPTDLYDLEQKLKKTGQFVELDTLLGNYIRRILSGEHVAELNWNRVKNSLILLDISSQEMAIVDHTYAVTAQQARGAWYLPSEVTLRVGLINLPYSFKSNPQFASSIVIEDRGKLSPADYAGTVFLWSTIEPLVTKLFLPFELRGVRAGTGTREEQVQQWAEIAEFYQALEFVVTKELSRMRYGGGWHRLRAAEQLAEKQRLLMALAAQVRPQTAALYRAYKVRDLLNQYYKKAKNGRALRRQVVTKAMEPILSGFFGGDWLIFLDYIEEEPHPDEQIATALPTPRLYATGASRVTEVAATLGIPAHEAERIAVTFWGGTGEQTPIERRISALTRFWKEFDELHARQQWGMQSLWGLVEDEPRLSISEPSPPYYPGLYKKLFSGELQWDIEQLWESMMLSRWPEVIVTQPFPHWAFADTFGPALTFWHGCALTAWFVMDGYSRTDIPGLRTYYAKELAQLQELDAPIDPRLFEMLIEADQRIGPGDPIYKDRDTLDVGYGISIEVSLSSGTQRKGFEFLRDIITKFRRQWSQQYLTHYLRKRWEDELRQVHQAYNISIQERGKAPTVKQFARTASQATNHWFGGDIAALYGAIGEKCAITPQRRRYMPSDTENFAKAVLVAIRPLIKPQKDTPENSLEYSIQRIAEMCVTYLQRQEALGTRPRRQEFTSLNSDYYWPLLGPDIDSAVNVYADVIETVLKRHTE